MIKETIRGTNSPDLLQRNFSFSLYSMFSVLVISPCNFFEKKKIFHRCRQCGYGLLCSSGAVEVSKTLSKAQRWQDQGCVLVETFFFPFKRSLEHSFGAGFDCESES